SGHHIEEPHPAEGGELALVRMEHVFARVRKAQLEHVALTLALDHRVGVFAWFERGPGRKAVEEVSVDVERVDRVELDDVDEIDPNELAQLHTHRVVHEMESDGVDGVDLVVLVEVRIECVLHHYELICLRTPLRRVDDEHAIETLCDVAGERQRVAVIQVQPERAGLELVRELLSDVDQSAADVLADSGRPVHRGGVDPVEVDGMGMGAGVDEVDAKKVALMGTQGWSRDSAVVGPGRELHAGNNLDLLVVGDELPLPQLAAAGKTPDLAPVEVAQNGARVEAVHPWIHGRVSVCEPRMRRAVHERVVHVRWVCRFGRATGQPGGYSGPDHGRRGPECATPREGPAHDYSRSHPA